MIFKIINLFLILYAKHTFISITSINMNVYVSPQRISYSSPVSSAAALLYIQDRVCRIPKSPGTSSASASGILIMRGIIRITTCPVQAQGVQGAQALRQESYR